MSRRASTASRGRRHEGRPLIRRLLYVVFFLEVGLLLIVLPWSAFWEHNYFVASWPLVSSLLTNNFVRGAISGLGFVNLCAAFVDLTQVFAAREPQATGISDRAERRSS